MIPRIIHYCWFGESQKSPLIKDCIKSWEKNCAHYVIIEWNEKNFDVESHPFTKKMYREKNYAFVADYVRLEVLSKHGGVYLDTDMLLLQSLDPLLNTSLLLGKESEDYISCGMIGAIPHHPFIETMKKEYHAHTVLRPNPVIMTELYKTLHPDNTTVMPPESFYPYDSRHIKEYHGQTLGKDVYGVHLWNYSWGHPLNKFFKTIGVYYFGKQVAEILRIKKVLKRLLGFI